MILKIVQYPDSILKKKSAPVESVDAEVRGLIDHMFETMYDAPGVGLAAPQVGILKRILVIDVGRLEDQKQKPDPRAIINPVITNREDKIVWEEGCLSLPNLLVSVERSKKIIVEGLDYHGKPIRHLVEGLWAVAFQHEIDHLDGILLVDRLSRLKRDLYKRKLERHEQFEQVEQGSGPAYIG